MLTNMKGLVPLDNVLKVMMEDEKCQIKVLTSNKKYTIKTATLEEATAWTQAINQEVFGLPLPGVICTYVAQIDNCYISYLRSHLPVSLT